MKFSERLIAPLKLASVSRQLSIVSIVILNFETKLGLTGGTRLKVFLGIFFLLASGEF